MTPFPTLVSPRSGPESDDAGVTGARPVDRGPAGSVDPSTTIQAREVDAAHDIVDEWGMQSFPASDPPANW